MDEGGGKNVPNILVIGGEGSGKSSLIRFNIVYSWVSNGVRGWDRVWKELGSMLDNNSYLLM